jgi:hypothetical protein
VGETYMNKLYPIIIVGILIISGFGTLAINIQSNDIILTETIKETITIDTSSLKIVNNDKDYLSLRLGSEELYLMNPGQPMMPRYLIKYELPFGATNINVESTPSEIQEFNIQKEIEPSPAPLPLSPRSEIVIKYQKDASIYNSNEYYPHEWHSTHVGCGINGDLNRVTHLTINIFPVRYRPLSGILNVAKNFDVKISYDYPEIDIFPQTSTYDMVIIGPSKFSSQIQKLVDHKNNFGVKTILKTTEEIYNQFSGVDNPEKIKYFIKDAIENWDISYVLLFGGLKSIIYAKAKDTVNHGTSGWHVPVRYSNFEYDGGPGYNFTGDEPGYISDLYYADIYKEGGEFEDWDSNGNGIFAEWAGEWRDEIDSYPDVAFGRLACRSNKEARDVVNKIINYEKKPADPSWFKRIISISGDGFMDERDWNIQWDTKDLLDGEYTIFGQSSNPEGVFGPIDEIKITLDKTVETNLTFNHDDHLNPEVIKGYPAPPITEIVSVSNGNTLGNTNYTFTPPDWQAYNNDIYWWANLSYIDGVLTIRGKSYDPKPYGNLTDIKVWIENDQGVEVFSANRYNTETYYEGEWIVGEKILRGRGGALVYMPDDFETNSVFVSNGKWVDESDVMDEFSKGYGLAFFHGHGSPGWWGDHYPGIPGNRIHGQVAGLVVTKISPYKPYFYFPLFPMTRLTNVNKLPVVVVGGCHNSMFTVSLIPAILDRIYPMNMWTYGVPVFECWSWFMVKMPRTGAIATIGNTGLGWTSEGDVCTIGTGDGWISTEFFIQYGEKGKDILGVAYTQAISSYITHHKTFEVEYWRHDYGWDGIDQKTVEQWVLLGDPSLKIGGYS